VKEPGSRAGGRAPSGSSSERVGVLKLSGQEYSVADVVEIPFYDCGC
jgi:hypothetical protein